MSWIENDQALVDEIASRMDLRAPNRAALSHIVARVCADDFQEVISDSATGVGKTYIEAALVEYLACQGVRNVLIVTPGKAIQDKTIANFTPGHPKYVPGAEYRPLLVTAENFSRGQVGDALHEPDTVKLFVFNVQQLIRPTANISRRVRALDEFIGTDLYSHLQAADDLVVIADEHHVYRTQAKAFSSAIRDLGARALVGLTATPDPADESKVIYRYTLAEAIADGLVKTPVIVYRQDGHKDAETQLADACHLRRVKAVAFADWAQAADLPPVNPVLFVVCQTIHEAEDAARLLARDDMIGDPGAVLLITSQSSDDALTALAAVEEPDSPIRAVVSVDKLKEGWDVKNIGVIVALRRLASQTLTEQILGRGLRLPYGRRVGVPKIDQIDLVAHDSYRKLLEQKDVLLQAIVPTGESAASGEPLSPEVEQQETAEAVARVEEHHEQGTLRLIPPARVVDGEQVDSGASLLLQEVEAAVQQAERDAGAYKILKRVDGAPIIVFPRREQELLPVRFTISIVEDADARNAGSAFAAEIKVPLIREALTVTRTLTGTLDIRREAQESETATQSWLPVSKVSEDLENRVLHLKLVEETLHEYYAAKRVVRAFLEGAGVTGDVDVDWGAERAHQAVNGIERLIRRKYNQRRLQPKYRFEPVKVPIEPMPMPSDVLNRYSDFEAKRWYSGWTKSILPVASFDAKTTEWALANLLDGSPGIRWWLRLQTSDPVYIELDNSGKYYPDFIAVDDQGVHWVIEGKSNRDAEREDIKAKKKAAEDWARFVNDEGGLGQWRYLFCTEKTIQKAKGSWGNLLILARPD